MLVLQGIAETMKPLRIALLGIGTVGSGVYTVLRRNASEIERRCGRALTIVAVADRDLARARAITGGEVDLSDDAASLVSRDDIDVVVELIGGTGVAKTLVLNAIDSGQHVVTANKALLAVHGEAIFATAKRRGVIVAFEAAVAGGIPIIKALREGLAANRIEWVTGIINGTTNFILSEMRDKGLSFAEALADAQRLGYAEADPTTDVEGIDAAHKLTLLASLAFGVPPRFSDVHVEGITSLQATDIGYAEQLGYRIKLLGVAKRRSDGIELRVHPTLVPTRSLIANVEGAMNAVLVKGDAVGHTLYYGKGAGSEPTASAIIADLIDVARVASAKPAERVPLLAFHHEPTEPVPFLPMGETVTAYYLRIRVAHKVGVLADITRLLADNGISIDAILQREPGDNEQATDLIMITHSTRESSLMAAASSIAAHEAVLEPLTHLRLEHLL